MDNYTTRQKAQLALVTAKSLARLFANQQEGDLAGRKGALFGRIVATLTHAANCMLKSPRGVISKVAHGNAALWQLAKHAEEVNMLNGIDEDDEDASEKLLQQHYYGFGGDEIISNNEDWLDEIDGVKSSSEIKKVIRFFLIAVEWGASAYSVTQRHKKRLAISQIIRSVSDFLLRYVFKDGLYKSTSKIGKIEMVTSALPHVYDASKGAWDWYKFERDRKEELRRAQEELARQPIRCIICQEYLRDGDEIAHINCDSRHSKFHRNCIERWFNNNWRQTCPVCRKSGVGVTQHETYHPGPEVVIPQPQPVVPQPPANQSQHVCVRCNKECRNGGLQPDRMVFIAKPCDHVCCRGCRREVISPLDDGQKPPCPHSQCDVIVDNFQPKMLPKR